MSDENNTQDPEEIAAHGAAAVAKVAAWHGLIVDLAVVLASAALAWRHVIAPEATIAILGGVAGARLATRARGSADGAILPIVVGAVGSWPRR